MTGQPTLDGERIEMAEIFFELPSSPPGTYRYGQYLPSPREAFGAGAYSRTDRKL